VYYIECDYYVKKVKGHSLIVELYGNFRSAFGLFFSWVFKSFSIAEKSFIEGKCYYQKDSKMR